MSSKVYSDVLTKKEIDLIIDFYQSMEIKSTDQWSNNKYLEYQIPEDFSYQLLNPKITRILGDHEFATGAYKECVRPYSLHVDTYAAHDKTDITNFSHNITHNKALLIPLVQGPAYKTVTFKCYSPTNDYILSDWYGDKNSLDPEEFGHAHAHGDVTLLPVDVEYQWRTGDILTWDRDQLHISSDFTRFGITKKFLILFIA
jgi:hypothetical protein